MICFEFQHAHLFSLFFFKNLNFFRKNKRKQFGKQTFTISPQGLNHCYILIFQTHIKKWIIFFTSSVSNLNCRAYDNGPLILRDLSFLTFKHSQEISTQGKINVLLFHLSAYDSDGKYGKNQMNHSFMALAILTYLDKIWKIKTKRHV